MDKFFTTDIFILALLFPSFFVLLGIWVVSDKSVTRIGVFFWGVALIAIAGLIAWQLITWRPIAALLVDNMTTDRAISKASFDEFDRTSTLLLWLIPFVTGSLGTNLISDALTKPLQYHRPSTKAYPVQAAWWLLKKLLWCIVLTFAGILIAVWFLLTFYTWPTKLRARAKVSRAAYLEKHAEAKQPWQQ
jgi:hypothetical protein